MGWSSETSGQIRVCPASQASVSHGLCQTADGKVARADAMTIEESRNGPVLTRLRKKMLRGEETPEICSRCINEESIGIQSRRQLENTRPWVHAEEMIQAIDRDGGLDTSKMPLRLFDVRLGNRCNLTCRMCSPGSSHKWYREWAATKSSHFNSGPTSYSLRDEGANVVVEGSADFTWYERSDIWERLLATADEIRELHFSGGEPLLIEAHHEMVRQLVVRGLAGKIALSYNTNLTALPHGITDLWAQFREVQVSVSLDAPGAANDYIRNGSQFDKIIANLRELDASGPNVIVWISSCVQLMNSFVVFDLAEWILAADFKKINRWGADPGSLFLSHNQLNRPQAMRLDVLPLNLRPKWFARHALFLQRVREHCALAFRDEEMRARVVERLSATFAGYAKLLESSDRSQLLPEFRAEITRGDVYRGQSFTRTFPELAAGLGFSSSRPALSARAPEPHSSPL